jgi:MYXO-CTERM domain-containing protein
MRRRLGAAVLVCLAASTQVASAERPRTGIIEGARAERVELPPSALVPYNTLYLNRCGSGCLISTGASSSITNEWGIPADATLTSFPFGDDAWNQVVACVRDVFSPWMVNVVTTAPAGNHFEIMIAGSPRDLWPNDSSRWNYGGVAPGDGSCTGYLNNALVFAFAKAYGTTASTCNEFCVNELCATAAQEIGHVWNRMDHVRLAEDPMTYFSYSGRRYFQNNAAQCGSDCVNGVGPAPMYETCFGTGNQSHSCYCGGQTQNSYQILTGLFGLGPGTPPTSKIIAPKYNESVQQEFAVETEITDDSNIIRRVEFKIDGAIVTTLTQGPFLFQAPPGLAEGAHHIDVIAYDGHNTPGSAAVDVIIGPPCDGEEDCNADHVCVGGRCVAGPMLTGGLGTNCVDSTACESNRCASDGTNSYCVELCMPGDCPSGFGCLDTGEELGVCWPGYDEDGGCGCQTSRGAPVGLLLAVLVLGISCRRRRR